MTRDSRRASQSVLARMTTPPASVQPPGVVPNMARLRIAAQTSSRNFIDCTAEMSATRNERVADISAVQSMKFLELVWAALLGLVMFGTTPGGWTLAGGVVILASTLWLARRESRVTPAA